MPNREDETQRSYFYNGHPPTCTCYDCTHKKLVVKGVERYCDKHNIYYSSQSKQGCPECDSEFSQNLSSGKIDIPKNNEGVRKPIWETFDQVDEITDDTSDSDGDINHGARDINNMICPKCLEKSMRFDIRRNLYVCQRSVCQAVYNNLKDLRKAYRQGY